MTDTLTPPPSTGRDQRPVPESAVRRLIDRITRLEIVVGAVIAVVLLVLVVIEPNILEAPFENERTLLFTFGGTALAAGAFVAMLWLRVPPVVRVAVLVVPFALVNWWLLSPYFIDDVVDEEFSTSIAAQLAAAPEPADAGTTAADAVPTTAPVPVPDAPAAEVDGPAAEDPAVDDAPAATGAEPAGTEPEAADPAQTEPADTAPAETAPAAPAEPADTAPAEPAPAETEPAEVEPPAGPVLRGAGSFVGLAGHRGTGVAGIFENPDGSFVLRFEEFDIENGPDLEVYLVPGANQVSLPAGSIHLGALKGNIGDQNYELPAGTVLAPGSYTVLVWCEAFSVEFVGATVTV